jgi:D-alanyl-D-alanine carboxypeptidase (penicillin-binding protein 5/6)
VVAHYDQPARAPLAQGTVVGKLVITADGVDPVEFQLVAAQPVAQLGPLGRVAVAAGHLLWGNR